MRSTLALFEIGISYSYCILLFLLSVRGSILIAVFANTGFVRTGDSDRVVSATPLKWQPAAPYLYSAPARSRQAPALDSQLLIENILTPDVLSSTATTRKRFEIRIANSPQIIPDVARNKASVSSVPGPLPPASRPPLPRRISGASRIAGRLRKTAAGRVPFGSTRSREPFLRRR